MIRPRKAAEGNASRTEDIVAAFRRAMYDAGVPYSGDIEADGLRHRIQTDYDKRGRKNGWYVLHVDGKPAGAFGTWKGATGTINWTMEGAAPLSPEERDRMRRAQAEKRARAAAATKALEAKAAAQAVAMWEAATPAQTHPYLTKKGLPPFDLRVGTFRKPLRPGDDGAERFHDVKGALLIPMKVDGEIVGLQAIYGKPINWMGEDRDRDFLYGARKVGAWTSIGKPGQVDGVDTILISEGYATGAQVHLATGLGVVVAFDAGNLLSVAETVRSYYPTGRIVILGDNDQWTRRQNGEAWNPGAEKAKAAATAVLGEVVLPWFREVDSKPTDFDDLARLEGLEEVERQVMAVLRPGALECSDEADVRQAGEQVATEDMAGFANFFRVVGHHDGQIVVFSIERGCLDYRRLADINLGYLVSIAPLAAWEREFRPESNGKKVDTIAACSSH